MQLERIQAALQKAGVDGWLFCDFHHRDPMAYRILGMEMTMTSRRWFYLIPAQGEPTRLAHTVEPTRLDAIPGKLIHYRAWTELQARLKEMLAGHSKIAMQYSPMNQIPYISVVDGGTLELVRSCGVDVVSSADLVQQFEAVLDEDGWQAHQRAGEFVLSVKDAAYEKMAKALRDGAQVSEYEIARFIIDRFESEGYTTDDTSPIVGLNDHPADPHFEPTADNAHILKAGDTILLDLWARKNHPDGVYFDVTWCGYAGSEPPAEYLKIWNTVCDARDAALNLVRDRFAQGKDVFGYEVDDACRDVVERAGYGDEFVHRTGHNIGREVHGNGVNIDNLETKDTRQIIPGICFSVEPGIYMEGKMAVRTEIDVFVTPDASVEVVGPIQRDLILVGV